MFLCFDASLQKKLGSDQQSHVSCNCFTFIHCEFSNVSLNCVPEKWHSRIGCICLTFLHCVLNIKNLEKCDSGTPAGSPEGSPQAHLLLLWSICGLMRRHMQPNHYSSANSVTPTCLHRNFLPSTLEYTTNLSLGCAATAEKGADQRQPCENTRRVVRKPWRGRRREILARGGREEREGWLSLGREEREGWLILTH